MTVPPRGVSVVLCTCNSGARIGETIRHLLAQRMPSETPWEVVLVDNNSTDGTAPKVKDSWAKSSPVPLRVIDEPRQGKGYALESGVRASRFDVVCCVDDDNRLDPEYLARARDIMDCHPEAAVAGGQSAGEYEGEAPSWLPQVEGLLAIGCRWPRAGFVEHCTHFLWGAGFTLRKEAVEGLWRAGYVPLLRGRVGKRLVGGEDVELCQALAMAGWRFYYDPSLRLRHLIPASRLRWSYVRRLSRGTGATMVYRDLYRAVAQERDGGRPAPSWSSEVLRQARALARAAIRSALAARHRGEGRQTSLLLEERWGHVSELLRRGPRGRSADLRGIRSVAWDETGPRASPGRVAPLPEGEDHYGGAVGVSVVICSHKGASRLPATMNCLATQELPPDVPWEVIVVDNGSDDGTGSAARENWPASAPAPLRVLDEPRPGKVHALVQGFEAARYGLVCIVDDDNRLGPGYLALGEAALREHPEAALCGGESLAAPETEPPRWFPGLCRQLGVGPQGRRRGYVPARRGYVRGAGAMVRRDVFRALIANGFVFHNDCRRGSLLKGGEDTELCAAVTMLGWKLWYEPGMVLRHLIPASRMHWGYFTRLNRSLGRTAVGLDPYRFARKASRPGAYRRLLETWQVRLGYALLQMLRHPLKLALWALSELEGDEAALHFHRQIGKVQELWALKGEYVRRAQRVRTAPWRTAVRPEDLGGRTAC